MGVVRTLVTSAFVGATSSARAGAEAAELVARRVPSLAALGARATVGLGPGAARADSAFRDELLVLLDDVADVASRQARHARDELGLRTGPRGTDPRRRVNGRVDGRPHRRHRVKA